MEETLDPYLHGVNGRDQVEVDAGEQPIRTLNQINEVPGDSVFLTINWKLQQEVSADLAAGLQHLQLSKGVAIVENVNNGQILAMSSLPSYNDNWFSGGISNAHWHAIQSNPDQPLNNQAIEAFAPGSTYKLVTATAALQTGVANAYGKIDDTGQIQLAPGVIFHGWKPGGLGPVDIVQAIAQSSDIYFYTVNGGNPTAYPPSMPKIGSGRLAYWARQYGLGSQLGIELPNEAPGYVPTPQWFNSLPPTPNLKNPGDSWTIGYDYNSAIGQGFDLTTPLQMVNIVSTIANGGTLYQPRIVKSIYGRVIPRKGVVKRPEVIQPFVPTPIRRNFINPANLALIQQGMHDSVLEQNFVGTSFNVYDPRIDAAGKTGTAEDNPHPAHGWWVGYAPFNHPKIAVVVLIPNAGGEGAYVAAPIAHKIFEDYFHLPVMKQSWLDNPLFNVQLAYAGAQ